MPAGEAPAPLHVPRRFSFSGGLRTGGFRASRSEPTLSSQQSLDATLLSPNRSGLADTATYEPSPAVRSREQMHASAEQMHPSIPCESRHRWAAGPVPAARRRPRRQRWPAAGSRHPPWRAAWPGGAARSLASLPAASRAVRSAERQGQRSAPPNCAELRGAELATELQQHRCGVPGAALQPKWVSPGVAQAPITRNRLDRRSPPGCGSGMDGELHTSCSTSGMAVERSRLSSRSKLARSRSAAAVSAPLRPLGGRTPSPEAYLRSSSARRFASCGGPTHRGLLQLLRNPQHRRSARASSAGLLHLHSTLLAFCSGSHFSHSVQAAAQVRAIREYCRRQRVPVAPPLWRSSTEPPSALRPALVPAGLPRP